MVEDRGGERCSASAKARKRISDARRLIQKRHHQPDAVVPDGIK